MYSLKTAARREFERTRQETDEAEQLRREEACAAAIRVAWSQLGFYPESAVWSSELGAVVLSFDEGATRLARSTVEWFEWHVVFECESCGGPVLGQRPVRNLAQIGQELSQGPLPEDYDHHRCDPDRPREQLGTRKLSEYLGEAVTEGQA